MTTRFRMFATFTVETTGRATWTLNEGASREAVEQSIRSAGPTWTPPTHYSFVYARELTPAERRALRRGGLDEAALDWYLAHNVSRVAA